MNHLNGKKEAVVLSGGASQGAYHAGVLKALLDGHVPALGYKRLNPDVITGTSAGAFNAAALLGQIEAQNPHPAEYIEEAWLDRIARTGSSCGSGVYRVRGDLTKFLDPACLISNPLRPMLDLIQDFNFFAGETVQRGRQFITSTEGFNQRLLDQLNVSTFIAMGRFRQAIEESVRFDLIQQSSRFIRIGAVRWDNGSLEYFEKAAMTVDVGPKIIQASAAVPGFFPRVHVNGVPYADGGTVENTPLQGAVEEGAKVLHVVTSFPRADNIPADVTVNTLDTLYRLLVINVSRALQQDVKRIDNINKAIFVLETMNEEGAGPNAVQSLVDMLNESLGIRNPDADFHYEQLTIHVHMPPQSLASLLELFNFNREYLQELIHRGYHDTVTHNCEVNGCVLPI